MDVLLYDNQKDKLRAAEIVLANYEDLPLKKKGWKFNWKSAFKAKKSNIYIIRIKRLANSLEGIIQLAEFEGMLVMNLIELAPHNIGKESKRYEFVAGCLIAFGCYESFKLETNYKGFLTFETKTKLRAWYKKKYYAEDAMGNKMFIWPEDGIKLINEYLTRKF